MRKAQCLIWVHPDDCMPPHGLDMQSERDANKVSMLAKAFKDKGFDLDMPALVGYPLNGKIQLLSGTHRHLAAKEVNMHLPVTLWLRSDVECLWGTDEWQDLIKDIPVKALMDFEIKDEFKVTKYEPVKLEY